MPPEGLLGATDFLKRTGVAAVPGQLRRVPPHDAARDGARLPARLCGENYQPGAPVAAGSISRSGGPRAWPSSGRAGQDARDEMVMRDLTLSGRLPDVQAADLHHERHRLPASAARSIAGWPNTYGDWRVELMYKELNRHDSFEEAMKAVYGRTLDQLSEEFQLAMRRRYYPSVDSLAPLQRARHRDVRQGGGQAGVHARHRRRGRARPVAYRVPANGYVSIYQKSLGPRRRAAPSSPAGGRRSSSRSIPSTRAWTPRAQGCSSSPPATATVTRSSCGTLSGARPRAATSFRSWSRSCRRTGCRTGRASW